jgi:predicted  nucleic acid-binding Zn-ribbon protein
MTQILDGLNTPGGFTPGTPPTTLAGSIAQILAALDDDLTAHPSIGATVRQLGAPGDAPTYYSPPTTAGSIYSRLNGLDHLLGTPFSPAGLTVFTGLANVLAAIATLQATTDTSSTVIREIDQEVKEVDREVKVIDNDVKTVIRYIGKPPHPHGTAVSIFEIFEILLKRIGTFQPDPHRRDSQSLFGMLLQLQEEIRGCHPPHHPVGSFVSPPAHVGGGCSSGPTLGGLERQVAGVATAVATINETVQRLEREMGSTPPKGDDCGRHGASHHREVGALEGAVEDLTQRTAATQQSVGKVIEGVGKLTTAIVDLVQKHQPQTQSPLVRELTERVGTFETDGHTVAGSCEAILEALPKVATAAHVNALTGGLAALQRELATTNATVRLLAQRVAGLETKIDEKLGRIEALLMRGEAPGGHRAHAAVGGVRERL